MEFNHLFEFLKQLQANNHKDWMDLHRKEYKHLRDNFVSWLDDLNRELASIDPDYLDTPGKKAINRINNNLMFFPNKPTYKDHFGAGLDQLSKQGDFYIEIGLSECFAGGGYWYPSSKILKSIREAIDYNGDQFVEILEQPAFKERFGKMISSETLKNAPKGFEISHPHIQLLKRKSFAAGKYFTKAEVTSADFKEDLIQTYQVLLPFRRYLNQAITV